MLIENAVRSLAVAMEIWAPSSDSDQFAWQSGDCPFDPEFTTSRQSLCFPPGEGLVGKCWEERRTVIGHDLGQTEPCCERLSGAHEALSGIAIPIFQEDKLIAVSVLIVGGTKEAQGALEIWRINERQELGLADASYLNLERFGEVSRFVNFPRRAGLPGMTWANKAPKLIAGIGRSKDFMRAAGARAEGLDVGLSLPIMKAVHELDSVVVVLSSAETPIARAFEIWTPDSFEEVTAADGVISKIPTSLRWDRGAYAGCGDLARLSATLIQEKGEGIAGQVLQSGLPWVTNDCTQVEAERSDFLRSAEMTSGMGIPIYVGENLTAVVVILP